MIITVEKTKSANTFVSTKFNIVVITKIKLCSICSEVAIKQSCEFMNMNAIFFSPPLYPRLSHVGRDLLKLDGIVESRGIVELAVLLSAQIRVFLFLFLVRRGPGEGNAGEAPEGQRCAPKNKR